MKEDNCNIFINIIVLTYIYKALRLFRALFFMHFDIKRRIFMKKFKLATLLKIAILGAISFLIMMVDFPLWFAPSFYELDFSDVPALIGAFSLGPLAGVIIELIKNILNVALTGSITGGIGEAANFAIGAIFVGTAGIIYKKKKTRKSAIIGMAVGTLLMALLGSALNYFVLLPLYSKIMPIETILDLAKAVNSIVVDLKTLVIYTVFPFNLLKGFLVSLLTIPLYKRLSKVLGE